ncbi:hypothetical protein ALDI51_31850 [Alicycliphilus denitrificans]|nr:hypothetical protein ALDI51_31850 [Alicycliphilus denitrificans]
MPQTPVCVVGTKPGCELPVNVVDSQSPEQARSIVAREAMRWTYVLRSRRRWVDEAATREQNETAACAALAQFGIDDAGLRQLAEGDCAVVRIPWTGDEALHWESRILPWEYVLAAATRRYRLAKPSNGRPSPLTVMRELRLLTQDVPPAPQSETLFANGMRGLIVECLPPELREHWNLQGEYDRLRKVPDVQWRVLSWPTLEELQKEVGERWPQFIHFAGLDSHQGMRELRRHIGIEARIDLGPAHAEQAAGEAGLPPGVRRIEDITSDRSIAVDGVLLRGSPAPAPDSATAATDGRPRSYPRLVPAHDLGRTLAASGHCTYFVSFNVWNSAARIAPLVVAERGALAAMGFQDAFDDGLAEYVHALMYEEIRRTNGHLPLAFERMWTAVRGLPESVDATGITLWAGAPLLPRHSGAGAQAKALQDVAEKPARTATNKQVRVSVTPYPELNYAVLHNGRPLFEQFVLECDAPGPDVEVDVDVSVHMGLETARYQRRVCVSSQRIALTDDIHVPLTAALIRGTQEAISSSVIVEVEQGGRTLYRNSHRLRLLPVDQWRDNLRDGRWLPSFVQPRDPAVPRVLERAQRYMRVLRDDPTSGFDGYQLATATDEASLRGVDRQVESIWAALLHDWQLGYVNPPPSYSNALDSQRLRLPSTVWEHRSGTCIDLALLFAACLEYIDIHPVIFLLKGHALPGWWRHQSYRDEYLKMPAPESAEEGARMNAHENPMANAQTVAWHTGEASWPEIRRWIRQRKLVPIETVRLTEHGGFVEAIESGVAALAEQRDFDSMLEIVTARHLGITPLPVREG